MLLHVDASARGQRLTSGLLMPKRSTGGRAARERETGDPPAVQDGGALRGQRRAGKRQDSERNRVVARVSLQWPRPDVAYAACSTAHTSPHRSWNRRRCSAKDTVSFICWR